jgi:uncharacterized cupin superfamily protein
VLTWTIEDTTTDLGPGEALVIHRGAVHHFDNTREVDAKALEQLNREIGRRTDVVGIFPDDASLIRLATSLVIEQNDERLVGRRYLSLDSLAPLLEERGEHQDQEETPALTAA